jgi:RNA polymerase sigma-70 factor, ECF subfamily
MNPIVWQEEQPQAPLDAPQADRFHRLYDDHRDDVARYVLRRVGEQRLVDAVADVFAVAREGLVTRPHGEDDLPWLYSIAGEVVRMHAGHERRVCSGCGKLHDAAGENETCNDDQLPEAAMRTAAEGLDTVDLEILRLRAWEELSNAHIAIVTGLPERVVQVRLDVVGQRLRDAAPQVSRGVDDRMWMPAEEAR